MLASTLDGKSATETFEENNAVLPYRTSASAETGEPRLLRGRDGHLDLEAWKPGAYEVKTAAGKSGAVQVAAVPDALPLVGPWQVAFPPNWGAPPQITLNALQSWSEHPDPGVKYFSGTGTYTTTFQMPAAMTGPENRLYLDLGDVQVIAQAQLNSKDLGILWKPPFRVEVTGAVQAGSNTLEVKVANLWVNRLIGDEQLPPDAPWHKNWWGFGESYDTWPQWVLDDKPSPTGHLAFSTWRLWFKNDSLKPSGLLGPVTLRATVVKSVF